MPATPNRSGAVSRDSSNRRSACSCQRHSYARKEVDVVGAVQTVIGSSGNPAADGDLRSTEQPSRDCPGLHSGPIKRDEIGHLASVERQFKNALVLDNLTDARRACLNQRRVCLIFKLLAE